MTGTAVARHADAKRLTNGRLGSVGGNDVARAHAFTAGEHEPRSGVVGTDVGNGGPGWYSTPSSSASVSVSSSMVRCDKLIPQAAGFHGPGIRDGAYEDMTKTGLPW